jgi:hypothetical protein
MLRTLRLARDAEQALTSLKRASVHGPNDVTLSWTGRSAHTVSRLAAAVITWQQNRTAYSIPS